MPDYLYSEEERELRILFDAHPEKAKELIAAEVKAGRYQKAGAMAYIAGWTSDKAREYLKEVMGRTGAWLRACEED